MKGEEREEERKGGREKERGSLNLTTDYSLHTLQCTCYAVTQHTRQTFWPIQGSPTNLLYTGVTGRQGLLVKAKRSQVAVRAVILFKRLP